MWPVPISPDSIPGFPYSLCQDPWVPPRSHFRPPLWFASTFYHRPTGVQELRGPHCTCSHESLPPDPGQGTSKGLEVQWGWFEVWGYECRIYPGEGGYHGWRPAFPTPFMSHLSRLALPLHQLVPGYSAGCQSQPHLSALVPGTCVPPCKGDEDKADLVLGCASCR